MEKSIPFRLEGPDGTVAVFNDVSDPDFVGLLLPDEGVSGLGEAGVREDADTLTEADGGTHGVFLRDRMPFTFQGILAPVTTQEVINAAEDKLKRATKAFRDDGLVRYTPTGGVERQVRFRAQAAPRFPGRRPRQFFLSLVSAQHYEESAQEFEAEIVAGASGGEVGISDPITDPLTSEFSETGQVSITNLGDEPYQPKYTITGPITNPTIRTADTDEELSFSVTLGAGETLEIDTEAGWVLRNGDTDAYDTVEFPGSVWFPIRPGANDIRLLTALHASPAALTVRWRYAWA